MDEIEKIGEAIRRRRKELGLSQNQLAKLLDVRHTTVSRWETGHGYPDQALISKLAIALEITIDELFCVEKITKKKRNRKIKWFVSMFLLFLGVLLSIIAIALLVDRGISLSNIDLKSITIYHNKIVDIVILAILVTLDIIFIFIKSVRTKLISSLYRLKYKHKFPADYNFEIRKGYLVFICILLLTLTILMLIVVLI